MSYLTQLPSIFPDFITPRNLLLFVISKEYLGCKKSDYSEEEKFTFYHFLFNAVKEDGIDIFNVFKDNNSVIKKYLSVVISNRISLLTKDFDKLLEYTHTGSLVTSVLSGSHEREDIIDSERTGTVCKYSLMGVFMKKFTLAFDCMSVEKIIKFIDGFKKVMIHYGIIDGINNRVDSKSLKLKCEQLSEDQVLSSMEKIYNNMDNILFQPTSNSNSIDNIKSTVKSYKQMYPHMSDASFLDHRLSFRDKNIESFEKDIQNNFPSRFLSRDDDSTVFKTLQASNKDSKSTMRAINLFAYHKKMSEISINSAATLLSMDFKNEALLHYKNALFNAKLSKNANLLDDVKNVGNSMMPINDNPNPMIFSKNSDTLSDKAALGNIRISMLLHLRNSHRSLAELLQMYFSSVAPQRREITPMCLIYLSIVFRSFGFESLANTYLIIGGCLESIRRTQNHEQVIVEVVVNLIQNLTALGHFDKAVVLFKSLKSLGGGILCNNIKIQSSILQCYFNHSMLKFEFTKAYLYIEKMKHFSLAEYGLRRVQLLFMENNTIEADRLGNHIISFANRKRDLLVYNHISLSTERSTSPSTINQFISGVTENSCITQEFSTLDDVGSQSWGSRDWAIFECRCHYLMCSQLINYRQLKGAQNHLTSLKKLSLKFSFYQFIRLCQFLQLALDSCKSDQRTISLISPLALSTNVKKAGSILSSRMGLSHKNEMIINKLILKLYVNETSITKDADFENLLNELEIYCVKCEDYIGQAICLQIRYIYSDRCGEDVIKVKTRNDLENLMENSCVDIHFLDNLI